MDFDHTDPVPTRLLRQYGIQGKYSRTDDALRQLREGFCHIPVPLTSAEGDARIEHRDLDGMTLSQVREEMRRARTRLLLERPRSAQSAWLSMRLRAATLRCSQLKAQGEEVAKDARHNLD